MKRKDVPPPPIVNARWMNSALQAKSGPTTAGPPIVNARWLSGPVQAKNAVGSGRPSIVQPPGAETPKRVATSPPPHFAPAGTVQRSVQGRMPAPSLTNPGGVMPSNESLNARNLAEVRSRMTQRGAAAPKIVRPGMIQRAMAAQGAPPFLEHKVDWAGGGNLEVLRAFRGEDGQAWLEKHIKNLDESEGSYGNEEVFDALIARNYAIVELTSATGGITLGYGISSGGASGLHGERAAFKDAVQKLPGNVDWTTATYASLWGTSNVRVSRIWTDRELCKTGHNPCAAWAGQICGGNGVTTTVYFGVNYDAWGGKELRDSIKSQLIHYLDGKAKKYFAKIMSQYSRFSWMGQFAE